MVVLNLMRIGIVQTGKRMKDRKMCAMRRREDNSQKFEMRNDGISNAITTCSKDAFTIGKVENMASVEDYLVKDYGVFKLSVRECGRLQGLMDADIDKMMAVNSRTQCYKQIGNAIAIPVLMGIFSQLNIKGVPAWNDMTEEERQALIDTTRDYEPCKYD